VGLTDGNRALAGAKRKGAEAHQAEMPITACPYADKRNNYRNGNTFSRAFQNAWREGWLEQQASIDGARDYWAKRKAKR
jgi:hypothetical protein